MRALLLVSLAFVVSCSSDPECTDGACSSSSSDAGTTSASSASGSSISSAVSGSSTSTGSGGQGGQGGGGGWIVPACATVSGTSAVTFSNDDGETVAPSSAPPLTGVAYTFGLTVLDTPNNVLADNDGHLLLSTDAGCSFTDVGVTGVPAAVLTAAKSGLAYGYVDNDAGLYRYDGDIVVLHPQATNIVGLGVDPADGKHVRIVDSAGQIYNSPNAGASFAPLGSPCPVENKLLYRAAFDPHDIDHVACGVSGDGIYVTLDAGTEWHLATGLEVNWNAFSIAVSPVDGNVVWAEGILLGPDTRHLFRSEDGGLTFASVYDPVPGVTLYNGNPLWPDPVDTNVLRFEFGTPFQGFGTDLYRYDHATGLVTTHHFVFDKVLALAFSPANPLTLYLGITSEAFD